MLLNINLENKCGSCCYFKEIGGTTRGECLQNPYGEDVVHDPEHPYWIVQRSRIKCRLYNTKPQTNADRIRAMTDEELAEFLENVSIAGCPSPARSCRASCTDCIMDWLQQPAEVDPCT